MIIYSVVTMDLLRGLVLLIMIIETKGAASFVISHERTNWTTASERCTLAEPDLIFSSPKTTVNISVNITDNVWIGYFGAMTAIEYFGCAAKDNTKTPLKTRAGPGFCMSACGGQKIIGIFKKDCYCFGDDEIKYDATTRLPYCNISCRNENDVLCGGKNTSTNTIYISLYKFIGSDKAVSGQGSGNCMVYDHRGFSWKSCDTGHKIICGIGYGVWIGKDQQNAPSAYLNWNESTIKCFRNDNRPSTYCNTHNFRTNSTSPEYWTGIIRSQVFYKRSKYSALLSSANAYAYLENGGSGMVDFKKTNNDPKEMKFLCVNDTYSTEISKMQSHVTPTFNSTIKERCVKMDDTPSNASSLESSSVGAAVGATLSVLALIAGVVIIVLFLRKRGVQIPFLKKEKTALSPSMSRTNAGYAIHGPVEVQQSSYNTSQDDYAQIDLKTTIDNEGANSEENNAPETSSYAHDYFVLEKEMEDQYDSTKHAVQKSYTDTCNPYNSLSLEEKTEYDHVRNGKTQGGIPDRKVPGPENTYNTTSLENSKLSTGESNNAYNMADDTDDAYNHINVPPYKTGRRVPENDYDAI